MKIRPWPIVLLAVYYWLSPLGDSLMSAWLMKVGPIRFFQGLFAEKHWLEVLAFVTLYPIAGTAVYLMRRWSYPVVFLVELITCYFNYRAWVAYPQIVNMPVFLAVTTLNLSAVAYFLLPAVRAPYFNPRLRWWESKPRYIVWIRAAITGEWGKRAGVITDISEGGVFLRTAKKLELGEVVMVDFSVFNKVYSVPAKVVHRRKVAPKGCGFQFFDSPAEARQAIRNLTLGLKRIGVETRGPRINLSKDFMEWTKKAITTGHGFVPNLPESPAEIPADNVIKLRKKQPSGTRRSSKGVAGQESSQDSPEGATQNSSQASRGKKIA